LAFLAPWRLVSPPFAIPEQFHPRGVRWGEGEIAPGTPRGPRRRGPALSRASGHPGSASRRAGWTAGRARHSSSVPVAPHGRDHGRPLRARPDRRHRALVGARRWSVDRWMVRHVARLVPVAAPHATGRSGHVPRVYRRRGGHRRRRGRPSRVPRVARGPRVFRSPCQFRPSGGARSRRDVRSDGLRGRCVLGAVRVAMRDHPVSGGRGLVRCDEVG
jgi:hypothetical protein